MTSARPVQLQVWMQRGKRGAKQALAFLGAPEKFLTTILVGNNISLIIASSLMAYFLEGRFSGFSITLISAVILLFFGEILPKSMARERATLYTLRSTRPLEFFYILLYPLIRFVLFISKAVLKLFGFESESVARFFSRKDLELLVREWETGDTGEIGERGFISRLILRGQQKVREIMVPRTELVAIPSGERVAKAALLFEKTGFSRILVYEKDIDEIVGMITARDLMLMKPRSLKKIIHPIHYTPETRPIAALLREMQELQVNMAVVIDEYGGTEGLVTIEDIVEEFFGEILDEHDDALDIFRNIGLKTIDVNAKAGIADLNRRLKLHLPEGDYVTLGGFLTEQLGHIPKPGERIELEECRVVIRSVFRKRVRWVRFVLKDDRFVPHPEKP